VAFRPEAIQLGQAAGGAVALFGRVQSATYLGTVVRYIVDVAGEQLTVDDRNPAGRPLVHGPIALAIDPARIRVWPADSSRSGSPR
jgi:hypothetical protein